MVKIMNPYRIFYSKQAEWHHISDLEQLKASHEVRSKYYEWYTKNWLPEDKTAKIVDVGCGSGQFIYFLNKHGYKNVIGIDLDDKQINFAQRLGLNVKCTSAYEYLKDYQYNLDLIVMLDILEHLTLEELFSLLELAYQALAPGGSIIVSVPNATSPTGLSTRFADITHETCFSPASLSQVFFCHDMRIVAFRDPWPAPVSITHKIWRLTALITRKLEKIRFKLIGLSSPDYWSPVIWAIAKKQGQ